LHAVASTASPFGDFDPACVDWSAFMFMQVILASLQAPQKPPCPVTSISARVRVFAQPQKLISMAMLDASIKSHKPRKSEV